MKIWMVHYILSFETGVFSELSSTFVYREIDCLKIYASTVTTAMNFSHFEVDDKWQENISTASYVFLGI